MNSDFVELPKHIKETLEVYTSKYETLVYQQDTLGGSAKSVPSDGHKTCRYCEKTEPEVRFKTDCHALLDSIGNRHLFAEDECDSCNKFFGTGIEDHFGKWSLPNRVISCVRGKKGYPSIKREHLGWRIDSSATGIKVSMNELHPIADMDVENKSFALELPRDPFIPIAVFKTFVRMGLAMMPRAELTANFRPVVDWLMEKDHKKQPDNICPRMLYSYIPHIAPPDTVAVILARRHTNEPNLPYMVFVLMFSNYVFQIFIPSPKHLQNLDFSATINPLLFGPDPNSPVRPQVVDLSGKETIKNEVVPFSYGFEHVEHTHHTSRQENIATRAYFIWQAGGSKEGTQLDDWLSAERRVIGVK